MFVNVSHFYPSLILAGKVGAYLSGMRKGMRVVNSLAYTGAEFILAVKSLMMLAPGAPYVLCNLRMGPVS